jgi:hypothetical protein
VNTYPITATLSAPAQPYSGQERFTLSVPNVMVNGQTAAAAGTVVTFDVGTQKMGACTLTASGSFNTRSLTATLIEPSATAAGVPTGTAPNGQMEPGNHTVTVSYTVDPNFLVTGNSAVLPMAQENATAVYTGNTFYSVGSATKGIIALSATIEDMATPTSDPAYGDIRNARVTFIDRLSGNVFSGCANLPAGLITSSNSTLGSASCTTTALGSYQVATLVGYSNASTANAASYYTDNNPSEDTNLTVAQSGSGFIIGDMISFQINAASSKGGGLWYSSNWTGTRTVEQGLAGGNLSVQ